MMCGEMLHAPRSLAIALNVSLNARSQQGAVKVRAIPSRIVIHLSVAVCIEHTGLVGGMRMEKLRDMLDTGVLYMGNGQIRTWPRTTLQTSVIILDLSNNARVALADTSPEEAEM